jgi:hypothetical protein
VDVDPVGSNLSTTPPLSASTITVTGPDGQAVPGANPVAEPDTGVLSPNPAVGFVAPATGSYSIRVGTPTAGGHYSIELHRVGLAEGRQDGAALKSTTGGLYASLNDGRLLLRGPTGYGFALRGDWTPSLTDGTNGRVSATYTATGPLFLQTAFGEVEFAVPDGETFSVTTAPSTFGAAFGQVSAISTKVGLPLGDFAEEFRDRIGLDLNSISLGDKWSIQLGSQIQAERGIEQALSAVPFIVYADKAGFSASFGQVSITNAESDEATTVFVDPSDPSLYVKAKNLAFQGSLQGLVPFTPYSEYVTANTAPELSTFFGHVYAKGSFPLAGLPLELNGDVVVDLDANRDGTLLGLNGVNAGQLFRGELFTADKVEAVIRDINVGVNGGVDLGYQKAGFNFTVPLGKATVVYRGPQQGVWFKGGTIDPWAGTPLETFQATSYTTVEGSVFRTGQFNVTATNTWKVFGNRADLSVTLANTGVSVAGTARVLGENAWLSGQVLTNGNFTLAGGVDVDFGVVSGSAWVELKKSGSSTSFTAGLSAKASWKKETFFGTVSASASLSGTLTITTTSAGSLRYSGSIKVKLSNLPEFSVPVSNNQIGFYVPGFGDKTITFPG